MEETLCGTLRDTVHVVNVNQSMMMALLQLKLYYGCRSTFRMKILSIYAATHRKASNTTTYRAGRQQRCP